MRYLVHDVAALVAIGAFIAVIALWSEALRALV